MHDGRRNADASGLERLANETMTTLEHDIPQPAIDDLDEAIDALPDGDRALLMLHYYDGLSYREVAEVTGKSEAASRKQASRALEKLGRALGRKGVTLSSLAIGGLLGAKLAGSVPPALSKALAGSALAGAGGSFENHNHPKHTEYDGLRKNKNRRRSRNHRRDPAGFAVAGKQGVEPAADRSRGNRFGTNGRWGDRQAQKAQPRAGQPTEFGRARGTGGSERSRIRPVCIRGMARSAAAGGSREA